MKKIYRQGDVLLVETEQELDPKTELVKNGPVVLAYGEVTGHKHAIYAPENVRRFEVAGMTFVELMGQVALEHEEHAPVKVPAGKYLVTIQTEYTPEAYRDVQD